MRILFAGKQHYDPGGIPASVDDLARRLVTRGHDVAVVAHRAFDGSQAQLRLALSCEPADGYEAYSADLLTPGAALGLAVRRFRADALVINAGGWWWHDWTTALMAAAPAALPTAVHVRDRGAVELIAGGAVHADLVMANAHAHVAALAERGIRATMIPSVVELDDYRTEPTGEAVVLINPHPTKGLAIALAVAAARPDVPFHFRESWLQSTSAQIDLNEATRDLANVTLMPHLDDRAARYRDARLLLVPYGDGGRPRVVPEAQVSGIPVLALDDPGLRECVGPGGIFVGEDEPPEAWGAALDRLWLDEADHRRHSEAARRQAARREIDPEHITDRFVAELRGLVGRGATRPVPRSPVDTEDDPLTTVVVPVRNVGATIDEQLDALAGQTYTGSWEVVVADNGCTDDTIARIEARRADLPALRIVDASSRRGVAHARNVGLAAARGELLLICDGDDIVAPDWLEHMTGALEHYAIVTGAQDIVTLNEPDQYAWTGDANRTDVLVAYGHLPCASGGNLGLWREVFEALGGFDTELRRAEDIDFSWRAAELGIDVHMEPRAVLHRRIRSSPRAEFASAVRGGVAEAGLFRRHRERGMEATPTAEVRAEWAWLFRSAVATARGRGDVHQWAHHAGKRLGRLAGSARHRVLYL